MHMEPSTKYYWSNKQWHVQQGYLQSENSENQHDPLSISDVRLLEKVKKIWHNHREQI